MFWYMLVTTVIMFLAYLITNRNISRFPFVNRVDEKTDLSRLPKVSVIIPMFNEAQNAEACLKSVLNNTRLDHDRLEVIVVDDQSTDNTLEILKNVQKDLGDPRLKIIEGHPRPKDRKWVGKNWACWQGAQTADGDYLLFIDADVRLKKSSIESALITAVKDEADLLTVAPRLKFSFLGERLIQPIIFSNVLVVLDPAAVNRRNNKLYFAIGPFMLFNAQIYRKIEGHQGISDQVLDDVTLAGRIKLGGNNLKVYNGRELADLAMYQSWHGIIEGWSKNYYQALHGNMLAVLLIIFLSLYINFLPWLNAVLSAIWFEADVFSLGLLGILLLFLIRYSMYRNLGFETRYWWLSWAGAFIVSYIIISSVVKTFTGWNWTWKGRSLD